MKDTFRTIRYKGFYIHSCYDRDLQKEAITVRNKEYKSLHSAKCYITRMLIPEHGRLMKEVFSTK